MAPGTARETGAEGAGAGPANPLNPISGESHRTRGIAKFRLWSDSPPGESKTSRSIKGQG